LSRLRVHVEGETEERFVDYILAPYLYHHGYTSVTARLLGNARQRNKRGGITKWDLVRKEITSDLKADKELMVTTMVDYYGLPTTWPGRAEAPTLPFPDRAGSVEREILDDVSGELGDSFDRRRFIPYVVMHEFEGLLFSDPEGFGRSIGKGDLSPSFQAIRNEFDTPEQINDSPDTAPSKRVLGLFPGYQKPLLGTLAAQDIGLDAIRRECAQFSDWIERLEDRAQ
jgi:hypothetical protein